MQGGEDPQPRTKDELKRLGVSRALGLGFYVLKGVEGFAEISGG